MLRPTKGVFGMHQVAITNVHPIVASPSLLHQEREGSSLAAIRDNDALSLAALRKAVEELSKALSLSLENERDSAEECIQRADAMLQVAPPRPASGLVGLATKAPAGPIRGGLAPWRIRRVTLHIETNLDTTVRTRDLAALVELSTFHFCRAFRDSFGDSPHGYVMRRRLERAQGLMLTTNTSLGQIAIDCGLADQAHFNRLFRRFVGESPGAWRRARATVLQAGTPSQGHA
jgi:AraC-like DNA-binding protein